MELELECNKRPKIKNQSDNRPIDEPIFKETLATLLNYASRFFALLKK